MSPLPDHHWNAAERIEQRTLDRIEAMDTAAGHRVVVALQELRETDPRKYWCIYGSFSRLLADLDRAQETASLHILGEVPR